MPNVVELAKLELVEHKDVDIEVPHEFALEDGELTSVNDIAVERAEDLHESHPSQISHVLANEER